GVGEVLLLALLRGVLRRLEPVIPERERHRLAEVLDRGDLREDLLQTGGGVEVGLALGGGGLDALTPGVGAEEPVETLRLEAEQVGCLERLVDLGEGNAAGSRTVRDSVCSRCGRGARGSQRGSFPASGVHTAPTTCRPGDRAGAEGRSAGRQSQRKASAYRLSMCGVQPVRWA